MNHTDISYNILKQHLGQECCNCFSNFNIQYHHIVPLSLGGNDVITNIVPLCEKCHSLIHNKNQISHSTLVKVGVARAKAEGKRIGTQKGDKLITKKSIECKNKIIELSKDFSGVLTDKELIEYLGIAKNTFYKYKKELKQPTKEN